MSAARSLLGEKPIALLLLAALWEEAPGVPGGTCTRTRGESYALVGVGLYNLC